MYEKKSKPPLISVITVVKNAKDTIRNAILSVANQSYKNIEYIVIDGRSSDGTMDILESCRQYIDILVSEPDRSATEALNKGLRLASGELVFYLNADDEIPRDFLGKAVTELANPRLDFIFGDLLILNSDGQSFRLVGDSKFEKFIKYTMPRLNYPSLVYKRRCFDVGEFDERIKVAPDYDLLLRVFMAGMRGAYCPEIFTKFKPGGNAHQNQIKAYIEVWRSAVAHGGNYVLPTLFLANSLIKEGIFRSMVFVKLDWIHFFIKKRIGRIV